MKQYRAAEVTNLNGGNVRLDEDQARRRLHNLSEVSKGVYTIVNPIQLKAGEKFGYDGEVNKQLAQLLELDVKKVVDVVKTVVETAVKSTAKKKTAKKKAKK